MGKHKKPAAIGTFEAPTARYPHGRKMQKTGWKPVKAPKSKESETKAKKREERNIKRTR